MALFKDYGSDPSRNPGTRYRIAFDEDNQASVYIWVRPLGPEERKGIVKKYEKVVKRRGQQRRLEVPQERTEALGLEILTNQWVKAQNLWINAANKESADFWSQQLGEDVKTGDELKLDDRLNESVKLWLLQHSDDLARSVMEARDTMEETTRAPEDAGREEYLRENSRRGSLSEHDTQRQTAKSVASSEAVTPRLSVELVNES